MDLHNFFFLSFFFYHLINNFMKTFLISKFDMSLKTRRIHESWCFSQYKLLGQEGVLQSLQLYMGQFLSLLRWWRFHILDVILQRLHLYGLYQKNYGQLVQGDQQCFWSWESSHLWMGHLSLCCEVSLEVSYFGSYFSGKMLFKSPLYLSWSITIYHTC